MNALVDKNQKALECNCVPGGGTVFAMSTIHPLSSQSSGQKSMMMFVLGVDVLENMLLTQIEKQQFALLLSLLLVYVCLFMHNNFVYFQSFCKRL